MKNIVKVLSVVAVLVFATSCDELINIKFTTSPHEVLLVVNPADSGDFFETLENISSDIKEEVEENGGSLDQIDEIVINSIKVSLVSGAENLDAVKNLDISIKIDGADPLKLASIAEIALSSTEFTPEVLSSNLKDFISEENYSIISEGFLRTNIDEAITLKLTIEYEVTI